MVNEPASTPSDRAQQTAKQDGEVQNDKQARSPEVPSKQSQKSIRDYFRWRPLPWWICFLAGIFLLMKLQLVYNDSPCAVLGTASPVGLADVKRAFRTLSMCTHPDRLRGRLKRSPTQAEERRGEIIFNRASTAKDQLSKVLKGNKKVKCYQGELELGLIQVLAQAGRALSSLGIGDYFGLLMDLFWNLVTFENGFINTLLSILWLGFFFQLSKQFFLYLWRLGIIRGTVALVTTIIIGPLPTLINFIVLPFVRISTFIKEIVAEFRPEPEVSAPQINEDSSVGARQDATAATPPVSGKKTNSTAGVSVAKETNKELPARNLRQRKKKETEEEKEQRNKELLTGNNEATSTESNHGAGPLPDSPWKCVSWTHREQIKARQEAAVAVQFDVLLILTKPVIPLCMLVALGQVWNGLFSSLFIGHALRKWVPQMSYEAHHLLCSLFGAAHTLLGVSAQQVEDYANREGTKMLHLAWAWSFKDVLSVMHMCLLGATVTVMSALGNEPSYSASFAAGIAMRIAIGQDSIRSLGIVKQAAGWVEVSLRDLGVQIDAAEEVVAYSGNGIGDCGGGPFRMLFGDGPQARWAAFALKVWLMLLPTLSTLQWLQRTVHAGRMLGRRWKLRRFIQRAILFVLGVVQICCLANVELNASNGALGNFWVAMLFGCVGESLLSTYDIRGPVRQIIFLLLFLLI